MTFSFFVVYYITTLSMLFGGLDPDSNPMLAILFKKLFPLTFPISSSTEQMFTVYPENRQDRYEKALEYNQDKSFFSETSL